MSLEAAVDCERGPYYSVATTSPTALTTLPSVMKRISLMYLKQVLKRQTSTCHAFFFTSKPLLQYVDVGFVDMMTKRVADIDGEDGRFLAVLYCCQKSVLWPGIEGSILEEKLAVTFNFQNHS